MCIRDRGAVFSLTLELAPAARIQPTPKPEARANRTVRPLDILVAEDHAANRRVVELILDAVDARLTTVENGAEAVAAATARRFDLILMDIQMPVMDGLTAIRAIRAHEAAHDLPRTPILTLTANAMREHVESSTAAGADGHISKPIRAPALLDAVMGACAPQAVSYTHLTLPTILRV